MTSEGFRIAGAGTLTPEELWQWDTFGYLVLPGVMDREQQIGGSGGSLDPPWASS